MIQPSAPEEPRLPETIQGPFKVKPEKMRADFVVVGGGLSGTCAAIAAARHGARTILIQNRPVLGGNASSEIGIGIVGASCAGGRYDCRETGILEEIQLAARRLDPTGGPSSLDMALWETVRCEPNCTLLLNTHVRQVELDGKHVSSVIADQQGTEKVYEVSADLFADCTGDGTIAALSGCRAMSGREAKSDFDEPDALEVADGQTMGSSIYWSARDVGHPVPFEKPDWAYTYTEKDLELRPHPGDRFKVGFWWVEVGGDIDDTITDNESIRDELWKIAYGLWDHIKNGGDHGADNYVLDRVGLIPGKRESRRILGEYVLREQDLLTPTEFSDAVAYGGWTMDLHIPGGMRHLDQKANFHISNPIYGIPWRSLVAKDCSILLLGGRWISATHLASGSARVMATCAVIGQALGTGAAFALQRGIPIRELSSPHIEDLQQILLSDDAFIPGVRNQSGNDLSLSSVVRASSFLPEAPPEKIQDGWQRNRSELRPQWIADKKTNPPPEDEVFAEGSAWISQDLKEDPGPWVEAELPWAARVDEIIPIFDSNLTFDITQSGRMRPGREGMPISLVKAFRLEVFSGGTCCWVHEVGMNRKRNPKVILPDGTPPVDKVRLTVLGTWGSRYARLFALRIHGERIEK